MTDELFDIVDATTGVPTGEVRPRKEVHALGLFHRAEHTWLLCPWTGELLLQRRASCKDSWPDRWDISSAGHLSAGDDSLNAAVRELEEELGLLLPPERFRYLFTHLEQLSSVQKGRPFINNEFNAVYVITVSREERAALQDARVGAVDGGAAAGGANMDDTSESRLRFSLQESELSEVRWFPYTEVQRMYESGDPCMVPLSDVADYQQLFKHVAEQVALARQGGELNQ